MTLPVPFRLQILKNLTDTLKSVRPANGYTFDLTNDVYRGRVWYSDDDPLPLVSILEPPQAIEPNRTQADNSGRDGEWDVLIQGWVEDDKDNPTDPAYLLAAEVVKALAGEKTRWRAGTRTPDVFGLGAGFGNPNGIEHMSIGAPVVRPADDTSARACFYLIVTFKIAEDISNPFG